MTSLSLPSHESLKSWASNKIVLVTGGAQGIGLATAQTFANAGSKVVIADIDELVGASVAKEIAGNALFVKCDMSSWSDQLSMFRKIIDVYGRLDLLVCNAAINPELASLGNAPCDLLADEFQPVDKSTEQPPLLRAPTTKIYDINITGVTYNLKLAIHYMRKTGQGRIVVIGSMGSYIPVPEQSLYAASKHAVLGLVRCVSRRKEVIEDGIAISLVAPGLTKTRMTEAITPYVPPEVPISSPKDIAGAVAISVTRSVEDIRGKGIWVQGDKYTEVEDALTACLTPMIM